MLFSLNTGFSTANSADAIGIPETSIIWRPQERMETEKIRGCRVEFERYLKRSGNTTSISKVAAARSKFADLSYGFYYGNVEGVCSSIPFTLQLVGDIMSLCKDEPACIIRVRPLEQISLSEVLINRTKIKLTEPLLLNVQIENQHYVVSHDDLGLLAVSSSVSGAVSEIQEEFSDLWNEYVTCPVEELTEGAKRLRAKLQSVIE